MTRRNRRLTATRLQEISWPRGRATGVTVGKMPWLNGRDDAARLLPSPCTGLNCAQVDLSEVYAFTGWAGDQWCFLFMTRPMAGGNGFVRRVTGKTTFAASSLARGRSHCWGTVPPRIADHLRSSMCAGAEREVPSGFHALVSRLPPRTVTRRLRTCPDEGGVESRGKAVAGSTSCRFLPDTRAAVRDASLVRVAAIQAGGFARSLGTCC